MLVVPEPTLLTIITTSEALHSLAEQKIPVVLVAVRLRSALASMHCMAALPLVEGKRISAS